MSSTQQLVITAVIDERAYQDGKWGTIGQHPHSPLEWISIMHKELLDAHYALLSDNPEAGLAEIRQVAAVAIACLEQHGVTFRERGKP